MADLIAMCPRCAPADLASAQYGKAATWRSVVLADSSAGAVNIAQQDRIAQREHTCPRCGAEPGKSCREKARGSLGRKTYLARPHAERAELVHAEYGLATSQASSASRLR